MLWIKCPQLTNGTSLNLKASETAKDTTNRVKRKATEWEKNLPATPLAEDKYPELQGTQKSKKANDSIKKNGI